VDSLFIVDIHSGLKRNQAVYVTTGLCRDDFTESIMDQLGDFSS